MDNRVIPFRIEQSGISAYGAFDALAQVNPEIAAVAYAHKDGILQPEIMPYIARFRELQTTDKLGVLNFITENAQIDANVEMNYDDNQTMRDVTQIRESNKTQRTGIREHGAIKRVELQEFRETTRTEIRESGATQRTDLECRAAVDMNRMKYEADVQIVREHMAGQRYLSDNQLKATYIEAQALEKAMKIQSLTNRSMSKDRLMEVIKKAEFEYLAKIQEAEILRATEDQRITSNVISNYLAVQAQMYQLYLQHEFKLELIKGKTEKQAHKSDEEMVKEALRAITTGNLEEILIEIKSTYGPKTIKVSAKNGKR